MSTTYSKKNYTCDCGVNYGSCGVVNSFYLESNNTTDTYVFYHLDSHREKSLKRGILNALTIESMKALKQLLFEVNLDEISMEEIRDIRDLK